MSDVNSERGYAMEKKLATFPQSPAKRPRCRHYWLIDSVQGPVSKGECIFCGAEREFKNLLVDCLRDDRDEYLDWLRKAGYSEAEDRQNHNIINEAERLLELFRD